MIDKKLIKEFNDEAMIFYRSWVEMELEGDGGPDMCESFDWKTSDFCEAHNISWSEFKEELYPTLHDIFAQLEKEVKAELEKKEVS